MSNDSTIVNVTSEGVAQAVYVAHGAVIASADGVSCVYTITTELWMNPSSRRWTFTPASSTIAVGEDHFPSLGAKPSAHRIRQRDKTAP